MGAMALAGFIAYKLLTKVAPPNATAPPKIQPTFYADDDKTTRLLGLHNENRFTDVETRQIDGRQHETLLLGALHQTDSEFLRANPPQGIKYMKAFTTH